MGQVTRAFALAMLLLGVIAPAWGQEHSLPSTTMYQAGVDGKTLLFANANVACRLVGDSITRNSPQPPITYANGRFGTHPTSGIGCYYDVTDRSTGQTQYNVFHQNYVALKQVCPVGYNYLKNQFTCVRYSSVVAPAKACQHCPTDVGNPISVNSGVKIERTRDELTAQLSLARSYNSFPTFIGSPNPYGGSWFSDLTRELVVSDARPSQFQAALVMRADGRSLAFTHDGNGQWKPEDDLRQYRLIPYQVGGQSFWELRKPGNAQEIYDAQGLIQRDLRDGRVVASYARDANGRVASVTDANGRVSTMTYGVNDQLSRIDLPDGQAIVYGYDANGQLASVTQGASVTSYSYVKIVNSWYLTEVAHNGVAYATFTYDGNGRAVTTEHAGGVDRYVVNYGADGSNVNVTTPQGGNTQFQFQTRFGVRVPSQQVESGAGGMTIAAGTVYDTKSNVSARRRGDLLSCLYYDADWLRVIARYDYPAATTPQCPATDALAAASIRLRSETTVWDTALDLPTQRQTYTASGTALAKQDNSYNARGQVLTSTATDPAVPASIRSSTSTYCEQSHITAGTCPLLGLVTSVNGPRTDVTDTTQFTYYASDDATCASAPTTCPHRKGDLWRVTNALGQVTETLAYDGAGRPLSVKDPNGVITDMEYHPRGWLTAQKVRGPNAGSETDDAITRYEYTPTGLVSKITQPDGSYTVFGYDAAHRLTTVTDNAGNQIVYTLDNAGQRTKEDTKDSGGVLLRTLSRVYNQLGQLSTGKDAYNHATGYVYDAAGNVDTVTDALSTVTDNNYDPLGRLLKTLQDTAGINAQTQYQYDALDRLTQVTDPKGLNTQYQYNGLGDLSQLTSPDTGITGYTYDSAGNRKTQTDARNETATYSYDALNRVVGIAYSDTALNVGYTYDTTQAVCQSGETFSAGRLTRMDDGSGNTRYCYDRRGNVVRKVQTTNGQVFTLVYGYTLANQLASVTYPSGMRVDYTHNALGQPSGVTVTQPGQPAQVLLTSVTYYPFGPVAELEYGDGRRLKRTHNQNYQPGVIEDVGPDGLSLGYEFDAVGNLIKLRKGDQSEPPLRAYAYDKLGRLTETRDGTTNALLQGYTYDATGNRTSKTDAGATQTYTYPTTNHRLSQVGATARTYDAVGNTAAIGGTAKEFIYTAANRMGQVKQGGNAVMNYAYNGKGEQTRRYPTSTSTAQTYASYDEAGHTVGVYDHAGNRVQEVIWLGDLPIGVIDTNKLHYIQADHLGTPRNVIDPVAEKSVWAWQLGDEAFGDSAPNQDPDNNGAMFVFDLRFPGQRYDVVSGLNYNYFRDYESVTGRYFESDPIGLWDGPSTYAYVHSTPLHSFDIYGLARYYGFSPPREKEMRAANEEAIQRLRKCSGCTDCGPNGYYSGYCISDMEKELIIAKLHDAEYRYVPRQVFTTDNPPRPVDAIHVNADLVDVYPHMFISAKACSLASLLAHEAGHQAQVRNGHQRIFFMEERCFGCKKW
ncbi:RHS repeat-associated core domain-containing protein [Lysobacter sp. cf310]|nr:RHS repeat-associated core domain-containing protein [Lysobacter sp. cf310]